MEEGKVHLTLDIPFNHHAHLQKLASERGLSTGEYILELIASKLPSSTTVDAEIDNPSFKKTFEKLKREYSQLAKNLAKR